MVFAVTDRLSSCPLKVKRGGVEEDHVVAAEKIPAQMEQLLLDDIFGDPRREVRAIGWSSISSRDRPWRTGGASTPWMPLLCPYRTISARSENQEKGTNERPSISPLPFSSSMRPTVITRWTSLSSCGFSIWRCHTALPS